MAASPTGPTPPTARGGAPEPSRVYALPRLRAATAADAPEIVQLLEAVAVEGTLGLTPGSLRVEDEAERLARLDLRQACGLVVVVAGRVRAFGIAVRGTEQALAHTAGVSIVVAGDCRRQGFGGLLLGGLRAWAAAADVRKLCASVLERNGPALALFHRAGYAVEGLRRLQIQTPAGLADEVLFGCLIDPAAGHGQPEPGRPGAPRGRHPGRRGGRRA